MSDSKPAEKVKKTILLVEDDATLREVHAQLLIRAGYHVIKAGSGNEALDILEQDDSVDAIISDVSMDDGDGILLLKETQRMQIDVPKIMITGFSDYSELKLINLGANCLLEKPVKSARIIELLEKYFTEPT